MGSRTINPKKPIRYMKLFKKAETTETSGNPAEKSIFKESDKKLIEDATKELLSNPGDMMNIFSKYKKIIQETNK